MHQKDFENLAWMVDYYLNTFFFGSRNENLSKKLLSYQKAASCAEYTPIFNAECSELEDWKSLFNYLKSLHVGGKEKPELKKIYDEKEDKDRIKKVINNTTFLWLNLSGVSSKVLDEELADYYKKSHELTAAPAIVTYKNSSDAEAFLESVMLNSRSHFIAQVGQDMNNNFLFGMTSRDCFFMSLDFYNPKSQYPKILMSINSKKAIMLEMGIALAYLKKTNPGFIDFVESKNF